MKHSGKARQAAFKLIFWTLVALIGVFVVGIFGAMLATALAATSVFFVGVWMVFSVFTLFFFRDPNPAVPSGADLVVSPAHGKVDAIDEIVESKFMGGRCRRVSVFLSIFDVHVQNAPVRGKIVFFKYTTGEFLNALKAESAERNENVLLGIESSDRPGEKIGVRLIAGVIARRIVPFVSEGDEVARGERISLIQFGSRTDLYLPLEAQIKVKLGDKVTGGKTIMASLA
jgi:phosphatidylserine decarboxylase